MTLQFHDKKVAGRIDCYIEWVIQLICTQAIAAEGGEQLSRARKLFDPVRTMLNDKNVSCRIRRYAYWIIEALRV